MKGVSFKSRASTHEMMTGVLVQEMFQHPGDHNPESTPNKKHPQKHNLPTKRLKWILFETGGASQKSFSSFRIFYQGSKAFLTTSRTTELSKFCGVDDLPIVVHLEGNPEGRSPEIWTIQTQKKSTHSYHSVCEPFWWFESQIPILSLARFQLFRFWVELPSKQAFGSYLIQVLEVVSF